jgi:CRISPR system Cascade subunit CasA
VLSFHLVGANVFESLIAGIPYPEDDPDPELDAAPWELDDLPDPLALPPAPQGVGGVLTGRFRHAVLLAPSEDGSSVTDAWITWAWREPHPLVFDPYLVIQTSKQGTFYPRPAEGNRALWRDLDGLLGEDVGIEHRRRPAILDLAQQLPGGLLDRLRVRAYGFDQDGQTRDKQWYTAATPPVLDLLKDDQAAAGVSRTREAAERTERHLRAALRNAWVAINDPANGDGPPARKDISAGPWPAQAAARYWPEAERAFWQRLHARNFTDPETDFIRLALRAYDEVTGSAAGRPRTARAVERARGYIFKARNTTQTRTS